MSHSGIVIKVNSGTDVVYSTSKPVVKNNSMLVQSLKEAKAEVNQFLTELVNKSGTQEQKQGADDASEEEQDDDDDDDEDNDNFPTEEGLEPSVKASLNTKRKLGSRTEVDSGSKIRKDDR